MRENSTHRTGVRDSATLHATTDEPPIPEHPQPSALHREQREIILGSLIVAPSLLSIVGRRAELPGVLTFVMSGVDLALIADYAIFVWPADPL